MENTQEDYKTTVDNLFDKIVNCSMRFYFNKKLRYIEEEKSIEISYENFRTEFRLYLEANIGIDRKELFNQIFKECFITNSKKCEHQLANKLETKKQKECQRNTYTMK